MRIYKIRKKNKHKRNKKKQLTLPKIPIIRQRNPVDNERMNI